MDISTNVLPAWSRALYLFSDQPARLADYANSFSETQRISKTWLIQTLTKFTQQPERLLIMGGWYGTYLIPLVMKHIRPKTIIFNDVDGFCVDVVTHSFRGFNIEGLVCDVERDTEKILLTDPDVVINTSCEHMFDMSNVVFDNPRCLYALQSANTTDDPGHINVSPDTQSFCHKTGIDSVLFSGSQSITDVKKRMMVIGYKTP